MDISVIVPLYKGSQYVVPIQKMVLLNEEFARKKGIILSVELIFVNDYPEDCISVNDSNKSFESILITNSVNSGIHQSRVNGLKIASGKYIIFLDQDDEIPENCFWSQYTAIKDRDIVVGNGYRGRNGEYRKIYRNISKQKLCCNERVFLNASNQIVSPGHCLIKKTAIPEEWLKYIMKENGADDLFLWLLMLEQKKEFCINHDCVYKHVDTGINLSSNLDAMYKSSDELCRIVDQSGVLKRKSIQIYRRRICFLKSMKKATALKKVIVMVRNADICLAKIYAYYR